ncbi:putative MFS transporter, AGZA family, xanthine/uracil permease [Caminicella sporogenes DSM 14501]|uniref:Putative MFS transporter, AGZA family, xanthine/uracil permease n=1 Tax=Caminicella sporogenes DSM 14501 TaxID=1121266 RepID=A0A1M6RTH9_9FIRM|nr:NCS2 family permease [Caminicella sporogenes]WIF93993.1 NCS2 family permease [Caminicella sporogenes]SHK35745.1 putative MFS transporter, AGZA family, xanthine/uracil permease [Caminicella sporogenes DSM 14501]
MDISTKKIKNNSIFEKIFKLSAHKTDVKTEIVAGITTFMTMAYILIVNPDILSATGMDKGGVFTATALSAALATMLMAFLANLPFALAPGMGLNAFFAFSVVIGMGYSWQFALTAILIEGIIFILLTLFNVREAIINGMPMVIKNAVSVGIGLFIAFIGFQNSGIIVDNPATLVALGNVKSPGVLLAIAGIILTGYLLVKNVKGALLIGMLGTTALGMILGITNLPSGVVSVPPSIAPVAMKFDFSKIFTLDMLVVVFTFLFVDLFDTIGTLVGVSAKADLLDEEGRVPNAKQALLADAIGTTAGAMMGTSTVTTYVESASGVAEGGRTGLTAFTTGVLFLISMVFAPILTSVPAQATAPVLILVGLFMMSPILKIKFDDFTEAIPAFLTIILMPLTYSIAEGIVFGIISYVLLKTLSGKYKEVHPMMYIIAVLFLIKHVI